MSKYFEKLKETLNGAMGKKSSEFTEAEQKAISDAANCSDKSLNQLAWLVVDKSLKEYQYKIIKHYITDKCSYDDYLSECFIIIMESLKRWNPNRRLTTYFTDGFKKACLRERRVSSTFSSRFYEEVNMDISKATEILNKKGVACPSAEEIQQTIADLGRFRSLTSIKKTLQQNVEFVSIESTIDRDGRVMDIADRAILDLEGESFSDKVLNSIQSLSDTNRFIMECECEFFKENEDRKRMTDEELRVALEKRLGPTSSEWVKKYRRIAERDFIHSFNKEGSVSPDFLAMM